MFGYANAREIIRQGIAEGIDFAELRKRLPNFRKRPLMGLVFDVMHEMGIEQSPFPGLVLRPRLTRNPIAVAEDGTLEIMHLLKEKGFDGVECEARCHIGDSKITLTVKPARLENGGKDRRRRLIREPIAISEDGTLNILSLLKEKGFDGVECVARCHIGNDKITLTVKPVKNDGRQQVNCWQKKKKILFLF